MLTGGVPENTVAIIDDSGGTLTAPILGDFTAVVCMGGTVRSHLGILTREYNVPCLMNATLDGLADGDEVTVEYSQASRRRLCRRRGRGRAPRPDHQDLLGGTKMPVKRSYVDLLEANNFIQKWADSFFFQCTTRTVQESKLFPVNPYIAMSYYNAWYRYPEILRKVDAAMPAEEIGDRARQVGTYVNTISMGVGPQFYLGGRQWHARHGAAEADRRGRRPGRRARLQPPAEHGLPPQREPHHAQRRQPQRPDPHRPPDRVLRSRRDRGHSRRQAPHRLHRVHGGDLGLRLPQPLRVPA